MSKDDILWNKWLQDTTIVLMSFLPRGSIEPDNSPYYWVFNAISCSKLGNILALKRDLNPSVSAGICALYYLTLLLARGKDYKEEKSGLMAISKILEGKSPFSSIEKKLILSTISEDNSSSKVEDRYKELLKDAIILNHYLSGAEPEEYSQWKRLLKILDELAIPKP